MVEKPKELIRGMKEVVVLLTLESCGLPSLLCEGIPNYRSLSATGRKAIRAAIGLGMVDRCDDGRIRWSGGYKAVATSRENWRQLIAVVKHHLTYLNLVEPDTASRVPGSASEIQVKADPESYRAYLQGVAESHRGRALAFSSFSRFRRLRSLVDLGGGLGAYSTAWVASGPLRSATLVDLPEVVEMASKSSPSDSTKLLYYAADLRKVSSLPKGELYLLANVLHLFSGWRSILRNVLALMPAKATLAILEAKPIGASGALFDLQVHLRSFREGGLIKEQHLEQFLTHCEIRSLSRIDLHTKTDPFERDYGMWLAVKDDESAPMSTQQATGGRT